MALIIRINNVGSVGIIKDLPPNVLPPEAWTDGVNVRFEGGTAEKVYGYSEVYNVTVSAATATQGLGESPWFVMPVQTEDDYMVVYAGEKFVYAATPSGNSAYLLNKTVGGSTVTYSALPSIRWNGCILAGVPILNNSVNVPQSWIDATSSAGSLLSDLQWDASASVGWASATAGAVTAAVFRSYREYGIAMDTTENSIRYPRRIRWSHPATPRNVPETWDETRADKDAGYWDLEETTDFVVDGLQMRDTFIIYKEFSVWAMQWTGGIYVHQFRQLFSTFGIMSANCVVEVNGAHVVLTDNDVIMHDGQTAQSIIEDKWRDYLFSTISQNYFQNTFLTKNVDENEVWICYPERGGAEPYWCTAALVWNWRDNVWSYRELDRFSHIAVGKIDFDTGPSTLWDALSGDWDSYSSAWGGENLAIAQREMIAAYPEEYDTSASTTLTISQPGNTAKLLKLNTTNQRAGANFSCYLLREGLTFAGQDLRGNISIAMEDYKYVRRVWPRVRAEDGTVIYIEIGTQKRPTDSITWGSKYTYTVGTDEYINCRVMGRIISIKFSSSDENHWTLMGYDLDVDILGKY